MPVEFLHGLFSCSAETELQCGWRDLGVRAGIVRQWSYDLATQIGNFTFVLTFSRDSIRWEAGGSY